MSQPEPAETGPCYSPADYAGPFRRLLILAVDLLVMLLVWIACDFLGSAVLARLLWMGFAFAYLVLLERSIGTLGYLLTGVRILSLKGERPSVLRMTFRLLLWTGGPFHPLVDFYWLTGDEFRQTLRDKLAGTVIVRKSAVPAGVGEIRLNRYQFQTLSFVFYEVRKPPDPAVTGS